MIGKVLIPNSIAMILLLVLLLSSSSISSHARLLDSRIFEIMIACNFLQCAGEIIAFSIDGVPGFNVFNVCINALLFMVNIVFAYLWAIYAEYRIFEDLGRVRKKGKILAVPAMIILIGTVVNLFTPVFFRITTDNVYQRTALFFLPYLFTYFYLSYGTIFIYRHKSQARKYLFLPAIIFMFPILLGSIVQFFFYGYSTVWVGVAIGLTTVYVNVQNETSYIDPLSGLYTRMYLTQMIQARLRRKESNVRTAGIMLDIDEFKKINDTYGHVAGDDAIRTVGKILHQVMNENSIAARYGGDEFIVLMKVRTDHDLQDMLDRLQHDVDELNAKGENPYHLCFSAGTALLNASVDTVDTFLERMDKAMYEVKQKKKFQR